VPVPSKDVTLSIDAENNLWLRLRMSGERFHLRLARGRDFARQWTTIKQVLDGTAKLGEVSIRWSDRALMASIMAYVPRTPSQREHILDVVTAKDRLWSVSREDWNWNINEDQIKSIVYGHYAKLQRLREDEKAERRAPKSDHTDLAAVRARRSRIYKNRIADFTHKASAFLVGYAVRGKVATIRYFERDKFVEDFPYFQLREQVQYKADTYHIAFEHAEKFNDDRDDEPEPPPTDDTPPAEPVAP
jgi:transposase